jgi:ribosomal protein S18 acetylase RimI-like enzyme
MKWTLRHTIRPGEIGYLTYLHGTVYAREYGYDTAFEAYVAGGLAEFIHSFKPKKDRIWLARAHNRVIGSVAIVGRSRLEAQLRWFFVHPEYRGRGIGKKLLTEALRFSKQRKYKKVFLWTTSELDSARHLYVNAGFRKTTETSHMIWGKTVKEERYDLHL